jgi:hypothetical protein
MSEIFFFPVQHLPIETIMYREKICVINRVKKIPGIALSKSSNTIDPPKRKKNHGSSYRNSGPCRDETGSSECS